MPYTIKVTPKMVTAIGRLPISPKHAGAICSVINRMPFKRALEILHGLEGQKTHLPKTLYLGRKYYSKSARAIAGVLSALSANARARGLEPENMILMVSAHQGPTMWRARRKALGGRPAARLKLSHVQAVLLSQEQLKMLKPKTFRPKGR